MLRDLAADAEQDANIDRRFIAFLLRTADAIPDEPPPQETLFRLGHAWETLHLYEAAVEAQWPAFVAEQFRAADLAYSRTLRQFPAWRKFVRNASERPKLSPAQVAEVPAALAAVVEALGTPAAREHVEPEVADALEALPKPLDDHAAAGAPADPFDPIAAGGELLAQDALDSIGNIVKRIAQVAFGLTSAAGTTAKEAAHKWGKAFHESFVRESGKMGEKDGPALLKWGRRVLIGAAVSTGLAGYLIHTFPEQFAWLKAILPFFG